MNLETLIVPAKKIRAQVIASYMNDTGFSKCICFTCGNAADALREEGVTVVEVSHRPQASFAANRWWEAEDIRNIWPSFFDATSGHLPMFLLARMAPLIRQACGKLDGAYRLPTGSGETLLVMKMTYPKCQFMAVTDGTPSTEQNSLSPLYGFIQENNSMFDAWFEARHSS